MRRLWRGTIAFAAVILLMVPRPASAGAAEVADWIIGLTGPSMWAPLPSGCEFNLQNKQRSCFISAFRFPEDLNDEFFRNKRFWATVGGAVYFSSTKDSEMREFSWFDTGMVALEPTLNIRSFKTPADPKMAPRFVLEHGAGGSLFYVFGDGFEPFFKGGIKLRPIASTVRIKGRFHLGVAYNLRIFPSAFTSEDFGGDTATTHSGREFAHGFTFIASF